MSDMEQYRRYVAANAGPLAEYGAPLVRSRRNLRID